MVKLYYSNFTRAHLVRFLLEELAMPHELVRMDVTKGDHKSPDFMRVNPMGQFPALVLEDGTTICECGAICLTLADLRPEKKLAPPLDSKDRAKYHHWLFFAIGTELFALSKIAMHTKFLPPEARKKDVADEGYATWPSVARVLSAELEGKPYLLGDSFTTADVMVGGSLWLANLVGVLDGYPTLQRYLARISERPAFQRAFGEATAA